MKKLKKLLPPGERIIDVGWNDDGQLLLCIRYFEGDEGFRYNGALPFSLFSSTLKNFDDLERLARIHFGIEYPSPDDHEPLAGIDIIKSVAVDRYEN